jgi:hypothetical protein
VARALFTGHDLFSRVLISLGVCLVSAARDAVGSSSLFCFPFEFDSCALKSGHSVFETPDEHVRSCVNPRDPLEVSAILGSPPKSEQ